MPARKIEYRQLEGVEPLERYEKGGYHPVGIGHVLEKHYRVIHKLGFGTYSTIWLATDTTTDRTVAIKVGAHDSNPLEATVIECLQTSQSIETSVIKSVIPPVLEKFEIDGPNGTHPCYVTTGAGANLARAKASSRKAMFQLDVARAMAAQLVMAVAHIHEKGFVHGDVRLSNVVLRLPFGMDKLSAKDVYKNYGKPVYRTVERTDGKPLTNVIPNKCVEPTWFGTASDKITLPEARIMLIDFGETYNPELQARYGSNAPEAYEPPEAHISPLLKKPIPLTSSADIWTLACSLWDLVAWYPLFKSYISKRDTTKIDITAEQVAVLGKLPSGWWAPWGRKNDTARRGRFDREGKALDAERHPDMESRFEQAVQQARRDRGLQAMEDEEKEAFLSMLRTMLVFCPEGRATASQVLESEWMVRWARPAFEKARKHQAEGDCEGDSVVDPKEVSVI